MKILNPILTLLKHPVNLNFLTNLHQSIGNSTTCHQWSKESYRKCCKIIIINIDAAFLLNHHAVLICILSKWINFERTAQNPIYLWLLCRVILKRISMPVDTLPALLFIYFIFIPIVNESEHIVDYLVLLPGVKPIFINFSSRFIYGIFVEGEPHLYIVDAGFWVVDWLPFLYWYVFDCEEAVEVWLKILQRAWISLPKAGARLVDSSPISQLHLLIPGLIINLIRQRQVHCLLFPLEHPEPWLTAYLVEEDDSQARKSH